MIYCRLHSHSLTLLEHFYALAEFSVQKPGTCDTAFLATFDKPELEFICDHDAILHINLLNPRLVLDSLRPGRTGYVIIRSIATSD